MAKIKVGNVIVEYEKVDELLMGRAINLGGVILFQGNNIEELTQDIKDFIFSELEEKFHDGCTFYSLVEHFKIDAKEAYTFLKNNSFKNVYKLIDEEIIVKEKDTQTFFDEHKELERLELSFMYLYSTFEDIEDEKIKKYLNSYPDLTNQE